MQLAGSKQWIPNARSVRCELSFTQTVADCAMESRSPSSSPLRHSLLTIRNLTPRNTSRMSKHERNHSEENSFSRPLQRRCCENDSDHWKSKENWAYPPSVPRVVPCLLCWGTQFRVRSRSAVLCNNRGDLSVANFWDRKRITGISKLYTDLIEPTTGWDTLAWIRRSSTGTGLRSSAFRRLWFKAKISTASSSHLAC